MHLARYLASAALAVPDAPALQVGGHGRTYAELYQRAAAVGRGLRHQGLRPGSVVAIVGGNQATLVDAFYGVALAGGVVAVPNPRWDPPFLAYALSAVRPTAVLCDEEHRETTTQAMRLSGSDASLVPLPEDNGGAPTPGGRPEAVAASDPALAGLDGVTEDPAIIVFTSGSGGTPKPVTHSHRSLLAGSFQELSAVGLFAPSFVAPGGFYLLSAVGFLIASLVSRGVHIVEGQTDLDRYLHTIQRVRPAAARLSAALTDAPFHRYDVSSVRVWFQGGYRLREDQIRYFLDRLGPRLVHGYGSTEAHGISVLLPADYQGRPDRWSTAGRPYLGVVVRIDHENGRGDRQVPGRVHVKSSSLAIGYYDNPQLTADHFRDGWYDTGDAGFVDDDGYLHLLGRESRDAFDAGVWPPQVELYINMHRGVKDSLVVARAGTLTAFVEEREGVALTADDLLEFLRPHLTRAQMPERLVIRERLPRDERGKIRLDLLPQEDEAHRGGADTLRAGPCHAT